MVRGEGLAEPSAERHMEPHGFARLDFPGQRDLVV